MMNSPTNLTNKGDILPQCIGSENFGETNVIGIKLFIVKTLLALSMLSAAAQLYVIATAINHIWRRVSDCCIHVFLLHMTIADFLLAGIAYPLEFSMDIFAIQYSYYVNLMMHFLLWLGTSVSGLSLVLLNLDKLVYFKSPLKYRNLITPIKSHMLGLSTWLISGLFVNMMLYTGAFECESNCEVLRIGSGSKYGPFMYFLSTFFVSVFPAVSSLIVALYLIRIISMHRKRMEEMTLRNYGDTKTHRNMAFLSRLRSFYFILISTVFTFFTLVPYRLNTIVRIMFYANSDIISCLSVSNSIVTYYLMDLNSILNPIITITVLPQYRFGFLVNRFFPTRLPTVSYESVKCNGELQKNSITDML